MAKTQFNVRHLIIAAIAIAINVIFGEVVNFLSIPLLFLDTIGTIYVAARLGLFWGILTGLSTNLIMGLISGPTAIPFALVNIAIAIVVYLMSRNGFPIWKAVITGLILSVVAPLIGTPIRILLFGGLTGSGTDLVILALKATGQDIFSSTFLGAVAGNFVDKIVSCVLVSLLITYLDKRKINHQKTA